MLSAQYFYVYRPAASLDLPNFWTTQMLVSRKNLSSAFNYSEKQVEHNDCKESLDIAKPNCTTKTNCTSMCFSKNPLCSLIDAKKKHEFAFKLSVVSWGQSNAAYSVNVCNY